VEVVMRVGEIAGVKVIPGMEVQCREEIHLLALFPDWPATAAWEEEVNRSLPDLKNDPETLGDQPIVDEEGNILRFEERLLLNSISLPLGEVKRRVEQKGGLIIPAHFDWGPFSLITQLGFIPEGLQFEALEMGRKRKDPMAGGGSEAPMSIPRIASSDAHQLEDIGRGRTIFLLEEPTLRELRLAFRKEENRRVDKIMGDRVP